MGLADVLRRPTGVGVPGLTGPAYGPGLSSTPPAGTPMQPGGFMHQGQRTVGGPLGLREALHLALTVVEEKTYLADSWLHASSLHNLCSMHRVLQQVHQRPQAVTPCDRMRWDIGHAVQAWVSNRYLGPMGRLYGEWRCLRCRVVTVGQMPPQCGACGFETLRYEEREVRHEELQIVGHLDGLDMDPTGTLRVLEMKTIDANFYKYRLKEPLAEHAWRTQLYCWLAGLDEGVVLYVSMGYEQHSPFKEYRVVADHAAIEATVRATVEAIRAGGTRACSSAMAPRAVGCPLRKPCWGLV